MYLRRYKRLNEPKLFPRDIDGTPRISPARRPECARAQSVVPNNNKVRAQFSDPTLNALLCVDTHYFDTYFVVILGRRPAFRRVHGCRSAGGSETTQS